MKTKTLIILGGVLVASVTAVIVKMQSNADTFSQQPAIVGDLLLKDVPFDSINTIGVNDGKNKVELVLKDGKWVVPARDGFPANVTSVNSLTDNAFALKVQQVQEVGKSQYARLGLAEAGEGVKPEETGKTVVFKDAAGKDIASLIVGRTQEKKPDENMFNAGGPEPAPQWIKVGGVDVVYKTVTGFSKLDADPKGWLDRDKFFRVEKHKSITVTGPTPEESWKLFRETEGGDVKLDAPKPGEEFDPTKVTSQAGVFSSVNFDDILPAAEKDKAALDKPTHTAVVQTFDGLTYTVKVGAKAPADAAAAGAESYYISYTVEGKLDETVPAYTTPQPAAPAPPAADAKEEDKKKYEEAKKNHETAVKTWEDGKKAAETSFQEQLKTKKEKLAAEQALQVRIFVVAKNIVEPIMKKRSEFMKDKPAAPAPGTASPEGGTPTPGTGPSASSPKITPKVTPKITPSTPLSKPGGKIEAVTPPIEVTIPGKEAPKDAPKVTPPPAPETPKADAKDAPKKPADKAKKPK